jgi:hypothetical protein
MNVVPADGALFEQTLDAAYPSSVEGLSRKAYGRLGVALLKTPWGRLHQQPFALIEGAEILAGAVRYEIAAALDGRPIRVCGIGGLFTTSAAGEPDDKRAETLVERLVETAADSGADLALAFCAAAPTAVSPRGAAAGSPETGGAGTRHLDVSWWEARGFAAVARRDLTLAVAESRRHGAPMTPIRGGEERDLAALAAMGTTRAEPFRFHLQRDVELVRYAIAKARLAAGLGPRGARELHFFIAEEGITAAAYVVIGVTSGEWRIEECGDRDPEGARVGAILQALIARAPSEERPVIRGCLPAGFLPPQVSIVRTASARTMLMRPIGSARIGVPLSEDAALYWQSDVF